MGTTKKTKDMAKNKKKHSSQQGSTNEAPAEREDKIELHGVVEESLPGTWFKVRVDSGFTVLCTLSGKLRQNHIHILPADKVVIEVSPYDTSRGRISWRR
jgi:translation initiation factor IF-1